MTPQIKGLSNLRRNALLSIKGRIMGKTEISIVKPAEIESASFRIIEEELRQKGRTIPEDLKHVLLRVIHTTADFEYLDTMGFS